MTGTKHPIVQRRELRVVLKRGGGICRPQMFGFWNKGFCDKNCVAALATIGRMVASGIAVLTFEA